MVIRKPFAVLPRTLSNIATGNAKANRPAAHLAQAKQSGMRWETSGPSNAWARGQFDGASAAIDFMSLMGANAQPSTTIRLRLGTSQAEVDGDSAPYDSTALPFITPISGGGLFDDLFSGGLFVGDGIAPAVRGDGVYHSHLELPSVFDVSWWRIDIGGHTGDFIGSSLILGKTRTPSNFYNRDREIGFEDLGGLEISRNGVVAETSGVVIPTLLFRLQWVSDEEFWTLWAPLMQVKGKRQIVYWCFDPEATARRHDQSFLGYFARELAKRGNDFPKANQMDFQIRGLSFAIT